jgi:hypothetical protein
MESFESIVAFAAFGIVGVLVFVAIYFALHTLALIHVVRNDKLVSDKRIVWAIVILGLPFVGAIVYFIKNKK